MARKKLDAQREAEKVLGYPGFYYQPYNLMESDLLTMPEQRAELKRLLHIARNRQRRLQRSEFKDTQAANWELPKLKDLTTDRDVSKALLDVSMFIRSRRSILRGAREYREDVIETLHTTFADVAEVDFSDPSFNWDQFGQFMRDMVKAGKASKGADSQQVVKMYFIARRIGLTPAGLRDNYEKFEARQNELLALYQNNPYGRRNISGENMLKRLDEIRNR